MSAPQVESFKAPFADEKVESWEEKVESWNESWRKSRFLEFFGWIQEILEFFCSIILIHPVWCLRVMCVSLGVERRHDDLID